MAIKKEAKARFIEDVEVFRQFDWLANNYPELLKEKEIDIDKHRNILIRRIVNDLKLVSGEKKVIGFGGNGGGQCLSCQQEIPTDRHHRAKTCSPACSQKLQMNNFVELAARTYKSKRIC